MHAQRHLLLVEDEPATVTQISRAFSERFPECLLTVASSGEAAKDLIEKGQEPQPEAVILDLILPTLSGLEVLEWLNSSQRIAKLPVIVFSQKDKDETRYACQRLGASLYQVKPATTLGYRAFATYVKALLENGQDGLRQSSTVTPI